MALHDNFRHNVRKRRLELRLTQQQVADKLGVSGPYISEIEAGRRTPSLDTVERLATALDCPALQLLIAAEPATT